MKKLLLLTTLTIIGLGLKSQVYNPISYAYNGTPTNGIKIKTNMPFTHGSQMPTLIIEGYNYGQTVSIGLTLVYYVYNGQFIKHKISSHGGYTPNVKLAVESGKVVIFIDDRQYFNRFTVRAFATSKGEQASWFSGWTVVDEPLTGTNQVTIPYENKFAGNINLPSGKWCANGNVGIGTTNATSPLTVAGKIESREVEVKISAGADFVFNKDYPIKPLEEVEAFVKQNKHLPEIAPAAEMEANGLELGEMNIKLLQKIEELTLYLIELNKENKELKSRIEKLETNN